MKPMAFLFFALLLSACAAGNLSAPLIPTPSYTPKPTATETPTPTATEIPATPTETKVIVTESSFWAEANVPMGLEIKQVDNIFYATNRVGQEIEVGALGENGEIKPADWLQYQRTPEQVTPEIPYDPEIALMNGILNAEPFPENIVACKPGDVAASNKEELGGKQMNYSYLYWSDGLKNKVDRPAKIIWKFDTTYENGKQMKGKVIQWLTPDGITYTVYVTPSKFYTAVAGDEGNLFPNGLATGSVPENAVQPNSMLIRDPIVAGELLEEWIRTGCPPFELQNYFLLGNAGIKQK